MKLPLEEFAKQFGITTRNARIWAKQGKVKLKRESTIWIIFKKKNLPKKYTEGKNGKD